MTKHERILSLDGEWLQFLHPSGSPGRTAPFHITQVVRVKPSKRVDNGFKLFFEIDKELKRYDLEAQKSEHIGKAFPRFVPVRTGANR